MRNAAWSAWAGLGFLCVALADCTHYVNPTHPGYGTPEFDRDQAACRQENTHPVLILGYVDRTETRVDEGAAKDCLTKRGWQPAGN